MKKTLRKVLSLCLMASFIVGMSMSVFAQTTDREIVSQKQIVLVDGSTAIETITRINEPINSLSSYNRVTYKKSVEQTNFTATLTATFSYSTTDKKVRCVSKYSTFSSSTIKQDSLTDTGTGSTCTVKLKYSWNSAMGPSNSTISMKCDYKGNI